MKNKINFPVGNQPTQTAESDRFIRLMRSIALILLIAHVVSGQEKLHVAGGIGFPELINASIGYQFPQTQISMGVGFVPADESVISIDGDVFYHFAGAPVFSQRRPWYGRIGVAYVRDETVSFIDKFLYINARVGREFNLSAKAGLNADVGTLVQVLHNKEKKTNSSSMDLNFEFPMLPSIGLSMFYRI
jgi:hypothetical protein